MSFSNPALPVTVPAGPCGYDGFNPSDAALVRSNATSAEARDNAVQTVETKFQLERSVKDTELAVERAHTRQIVHMETVRKDLADSIKDEGQRTRDLLRDQEQARLAASIANMTIQNAILQNRLPLTPASA